MTFIRKYKKIHAVNNTDSNGLRKFTLKGFLYFFCIVILFSSYGKIRMNKAPETNQRAISEPAGFSHPGILNTVTTLDFIRSEMDVENAGRVEAYEQVLAFINNNPLGTKYSAVVKAKASGGTPTEDHIRRDALLAYAYALKWARTGDAGIADKTKKILNGWARHFQKYEPVKGTPKEQCQLEASWVAPSFVAAAEIIRYVKVNGKSAGWPHTDISVFNGFIQNLKNNYIDAMIEDIRNKNRRHNNWGVSAGYAKMAIGVFLDSREVYEDGKKVILDLLPDVIKPTGEILEYCARDCHHPQYSMSGLTLAAEIARNQGDVSIYTAVSSRLKTGWEWMGKAYQGKVECRDCSTARIYSAIEVANNYYKSPVIKHLLESKHPLEVTTDRTFLDFFTYTHYKVPE